jgi:hypothetical protein
LLFRFWNLYGTYDRAILDVIFENIFKESKDPSDQQLLQFLKYTISGNIFLASTLHTHGPLTGIDEAYDQIVGKLKTSALPELRRVRQLVADLPETEIKKPLPTSRLL